MEKSALLDTEIYSLLWENNFFHDYYVEKINFYLIGNKFKLLLSENNDVLFSIVMKRLFSFTYDIDFLVEEKYYNTLSWNSVFSFVRFRHLLNIDISESKYNDISVKYLSKKALNIALDFDCGFKIKIDCLDFSIEKLQCRTKKSL